MGESVFYSSPIRSKLSRQVGSEVRVRFRKGRYQAGRSKFVDRVIEPRNMYSRGHWDNLRNSGGKADAIEPAEGSSPEGDRQADRTPPGLENDLILQTRRHW